MDLAGRRVVVTRAAGQHRELADLLTGRGAVPIHFPTVAIRPAADRSALDDALRRLVDFDWLIFTSANAVAHTLDRIPPAPAWPAGVRVAAIGPATSRALADRGVPVSAMPSVHEGAAIPEALGDLAGRRVLLPRADIGRDETVLVLREAGAEVTAVTAYHTIPGTPDPGGLAALRAGIDAVTFTSPSTVRNWIVLLGAEGVDLLQGAAVACIGPTTADPVLALGVAAPLVAPEATSAGLVEVLADHFARRSRPA